METEPRAIDKESAIGIPPIDPITPIIYHNLSLV